MVYDPDGALLERKAAELVSDTSCSSARNAQVALEVRQLSGLPAQLLMTFCTHPEGREGLVPWVAWRLVTRIAVNNACDRALRAFVRYNEAHGESSYFKAKIE